MIKEKVICEPLNPSVMSLALKSLTGTSTPSVPQLVFPILETIQEALSWERREQRGKEFNKKEILGKMKYCFSVCIAVSPDCQALTACLLHALRGRIISRICLQKAKNL
jgi:hypothetical protein